MHRPHRLTLLAAALAMAGCAPSTPGGTSATDAAQPAAAPAPTVAAAEPAPAASLGAILTGYRWQLASATDTAGQSIAALFPGPEHLLGLEFVDGQVGVTGGCNRLSAGYQLVEPAQLQVGPGRSTMMACPPPLGDTDAAIGRFLTGTLQAELTGEPGAPVLRLAATDGTALVWNGTPTPETRFGGPGTRAFLEVSTEPCPPPDSSASGCLMVRDRFFDEQGLRTGTPGEWRPLPEGIEGYAPVAGQQQVVRVKRFEVPGTAGGESQGRFVFDMTVESRTIQ
jgi:hypothetical protein